MSIVIYNITFKGGNIMNKKLAEFCQSYGLTADGDCAHGVLRGYETAVLWHQFNVSYPVRLYISFYGSEEQKRAIESAVRKLAIPYSMVSATSYGIVMGLNDALTVGRLLKRLPSVIDGVYGILESQGVKGVEYCPVCGEALADKENRQFDVDGVKITLHEECAGDINRAIEKENAEFAAAPNNYLKGFAGAVIGALGGVVVAVLLYIVGFISAICAVISMALGTYLYKKFGGKPDKIMIVIVALTTLVLMELSVFVIYIVAAGIAATEAGLIISAWDAFVLLMEESSFSGMLFADLALTFIFSALGAGFEIYALARQVRRKDTIK